MPPAPPAIKAPTVNTATVAPSPPSIVAIQEVAPTAIEVVMPTTQAGSVVALSSTVVAPLLSVGVAATSAPTMLSPSSATPVTSPFTVLVAVVSPLLSSRPRILFDHLYTLVMLTHYREQLISRSRRPQLALCQPSTRTLLGRVGCKMLLTLLKFFSKGVCQFYRRMDCGTKRLCRRRRPWR